MSNWGVVAEACGWAFVPPLVFAVLLPLEARTGFMLVLPLVVMLGVLLFRRAWRAGILSKVHWLTRALALNLAVGVFMVGWLLALVLLGRLFGSPGG